MSLLKCLLVAVAVAVAGSFSLAEARECKVKKGSHVWKHAGGTFRRIKGTLNWEEANEKGEGHTVFTEVTRENDNLVIRNEERGVNILLRNDMAGIQNKGQNGYQQLYAGSWLKTVDCTEAAEGKRKKKK